MTTVTLRLKKSKRKRTYLYLDYYPPYMDPVTRVTKRQEYLGMYIYTTPVNILEKDYNKKVMATAEAIRNKRAVAVMNREAGIFDSENQRKDFLLYFEKQCKGKHRAWTLALKHFSAFMNGKCRFGNITHELCKAYREYLVTDAKVLNSAPILGRGKKLSSESAHKCLLYFKTVLKNAYDDKYLKDDFARRLEAIPARTESRREYLTLDEIDILYNTPCKWEPLKNAAMFSIYTGLRLSDILDLRWKDITTAPDGKPCVRKKMIKGSRDVTVMISEKVLRFCGERRDGELPVFKDFKLSMTERPLKIWLKDSKIPKHITFHSFRHTHATLLLSKGIDIYTVSGMLAHTSVKTTQIYAHLIDSKKRDAADCIDGML